MTLQEFKKLISQKGFSIAETQDGLVVSGVGYVDLSSLTTLPGGIKFENQGSVFLNSLTTLPGGIKFENQGYVDLSSLTTLPGGIKFENQGYVDLSSLTTLPGGIKFENQGSVFLNSLTTLPGGIKFENQGSVFLNSLTTLPGGIKFENQGPVFLNSLTTLPGGIKFENQGYVDLSSLTTLPGGIKFENQGYVDLSSLTTLPGGIKFENQGPVFLNSLTTESIQYLGRTLKLKFVDGYTMIVGRKQEIDGVSVMRSRYFKGGAYEDMPACFVAELDGLYAHGETKQDAIRDVRFKKAQRDFDATDLAEQIRQRGNVTIEDYRLMTGACELGCKQFLTDHGINPDEIESLPLEKVLEMTRDAFGGLEFAEHFEAEAV